MIGNDLYQTPPKCRWEVHMLRDCTMVEEGAALEVQPLRPWLGG